MSGAQTISPDAVGRYKAAVDALNRGDWPQAQHLSMHLLREVPPHAGLYFVAGVAARELSQIPLALQCLERATRLNPSRADYLSQLARALASASMPREATEAADRAAELAPADPMTLDTLAVVYNQVHAYEKATAMFRHAVEMAPGVASFRFNFATMLVFAGDVEGAERELEACLAIDEKYWKAHLTLAQIRKHTAQSNHIPRLRDLLDRFGDDANAAMFLNLALFKETEDLSEYPVAFDYLVAAKASGRRMRAYDPATDAALFSAIQQAVPDAGADGGGFDSGEPIFIIGLPRTGTTLVERIISSHPDVYSAGELQNFGVALKRASASQTQRMLDIDTIKRSSRLDWRALGEEYLSSTRPQTGRHPRFIDKLPHNFLYAGFIAKALPNAKLICLRRDPMDSCLSNFRQLFALSTPYYDYSFDLLDTGRYYVLFDQLMSHWRKVFPGRILEVDYEALVDAQEANSRRLLEFCGLPWDDACLRFEENDAPVSTASAIQVRSPIYRTAVKRWKRYEPQLQALRALLSDAGIKVED